MLLLGVIYLIWNALIHLNGQIWMTLKTTVDNKLLSLSKPQSWEGKGIAIAIEVSGLSIFYCICGL